MCDYLAKFYITIVNLVEESYVLLGTPPCLVKTTNFQHCHYIKNKKPNDIDQMCAKVHECIYIL